VIYSHKIVSGSVTFCVFDIPIVSTDRHMDDFTWTLLYKLCIYNKSILWHTAAAVNAIKQFIYPSFSDRVIY